MLFAEHDARQEITREDVCAAFEVAKNPPLAATVRALSDEGRELLQCSAERSCNGAEYSSRGAL